MQKKKKKKKIIILYIRKRGFGVGWGGMGWAWGFFFFFLDGEIFLAKIFFEEPFFPSKSSGEQAKYIFFYHQVIKKKFSVNFRRDTNTSSTLHTIICIRKALH